jgi:hypothetical protein
MGGKEILALQQFFVLSVSLCGYSIAGVPTATRITERSIRMTRKKENSTSKNVSGSA